MKPSEQAKAVGLNLKQVGERVNKKSNTLINWHRDNPELFEIVLLGCKAKLDQDE